MNKLMIAASAGIAAVLIATAPAPRAAYASGIEWEPIPVAEEQDELQETAAQYLAYMGCECPEYLWPYFDLAGEKYGIRPELLAAIAWKESTFRPEAVNGDCKGLMQVSARWHTGRMHDLGYSDLFRVQDNVETAAHYLREILSTEPDLGRALMVYNGDTRTGISQYARDVIAVSIALEETRK